LQILDFGFKYKDNSNRRMVGVNSQKDFHPSYIWQVCWELSIIAGDREQGTGDSARSLFMD
jgi:hypothetical protein